MSFRNPVFTARMASAVDDLSLGRLKLGLGAGWQEREHKNYGFDLLDPEERFLRFEEGLKIITGLFTSITPFSFNGEFYQLNDAVLLPKPHREGGPEIVIGGNGKRFTIPMVVAYANEWNTVFIPPEKFASLNAVLDKQLAETNKRGKKIRRTLMTNLTYAQTDSELTKKLNGRDSSELEQRGIIVGKTPQVIEKLKQFEELGCEEIMLQWIDLDDIEGLLHFSINVLPEFHFS
jgi:alkanesulfonate monooxygenase SsuD/methylene tetrahydromethanopterin reductase-like flavin-dependent oxidoreductase (luciferase family)